MTGDEQQLKLPEQVTGPFIREFRPGGLPRPAAQVASVVFYNKGGYSVITALGTEHFDRRWAARPVSVCVVAQGTHVAHLELDLPARDGATFFKVEVDVHWSVNDFLLVVQERVTDVAERLTAPIMERLRQVCERYEVREAPEANRAVDAQCGSGNWDDLGHHLGLRARLFVRFTTDEKTINQVDDQRDHDNKVAEERRRVELLQMRMAQFRSMIAGGQWEQIAFMLADQPEEARSFMELLRQESRDDRRGLLDHTLRLIEQGVIQSPELEAQIRERFEEGGYRVDGSLGRPPQRPAVGYTPSWLDGGGGDGEGPGLDGEGLAGDAADGERRSGAAPGSGSVTGSVNGSGGPKRPPADEPPRRRVRRSAAFDDWDLESQDEPR